MTITSLKLSDELKKRIAALVAGSSQSAHAFMVEAIARETERAELRHRFLEDARKAEDEVLGAGKVYDAEEVFDYLEAKAKDRDAKRPRAKTWQRPS
ncbi:MAG: CopG family ribbon-helix-helix protein [Gammaproteobacteria bacterium]